MIEIRHLTKKYGENTAVNDLSITLETGHIYGFLGPNGAGKTTTMNIITGYTGATSGEVIINGYDINKEPLKAKQCMGYLPELPPVYGDMRVSEYLSFVADLKQLNRQTRTADIRQAMDLTKLHEMKDRLIRNLSKGYRQRVGLAQALMGMPEIIILDEPTVGLDPKQIIEIRDLIKSLKENHTVILSSHILQEISAVCDHVFIISNGNLVASDTMENLEEQMSGSQKLTVTLRTTEEAAQSLESLAGVKAVEVLDVKLPGQKSGAVQAAEGTEEPELLEPADHTELPEPAEDTERKKASESISPDAGVTAAETGEYAAEAASEEDGGYVTDTSAEVSGEFETDTSAEASGEFETDTAAEAVEENVTDTSAEASGEFETDTAAEAAEENVTDTSAEASGEFETDTAAEPAVEYEPESGTTELSEDIQEVRLEITAKPGKDVREDVFRYCAEHDLILLEMTSVTISLEDVFLELTDAKEVE